MTFNVWTFLFEIVNFVVLAYILHRLLYRPLRQAIDARRAAANRSQVEADNARAEAVALQQQLEGRLADIDRHRQESIRQAREQAEAERKKLLQETEQTVQRRQEELRQALDRERAEALADLRTEVIQQAIEMSARILTEASDLTLSQQLALRLVERLTQLSSTDREHLREQWRPADDATILETAAELPEATLQQIKDALTSVLGQEPNLVVRTRATLLGGVRLRVAGQVWDTSLAGTLEGGSKAAPEALSHA
jgi:F-type H+-transporting ATPase subunit b